MAKNTPGLSHGWSFPGNSVVTSQMGLFTTWISDHGEMAPHLPSAIMPTWLTLEVTVLTRALVPCSKAETSIGVNWSLGLSVHKGATLRESGTAWNALPRLIAGHLLLLPQPASARQNPCLRNILKVGHSGSVLALWKTPVGKKKNKCLTFQGQGQIHLLIALRMSLSPKQTLPFEKIYPGISSLSPLVLVWIFLFWLLFWSHGIYIRRTVPILPFHPSNCRPERHFGVRLGGEMQQERVISPPPDTGQHCHRSQPSILSQSSTDYDSFGQLH